MRHRTDKLRLIILPAAAVIMLMSGCTAKTDNSYYTIDGFAQGTTYHMVFSCADTTGITRGIDSIFTMVDNSASVYNPNSLLSRINRNETDSVDKVISECIEFAAAVSRTSNGALDITVKPLTQAWGFAGIEADSQPDIDSLLDIVGYTKIRIEGSRIYKDDPRMQIDLNCVAKGYTSDLIGEFLLSRGIADFLVEIGGEISCRGTSSRGGAWVVGIDRPMDGNYIPGRDLQVKISFTDRCLATSGNYRKFRTDAAGNRVNHIIDARTGQSIGSDVLSATVIAPSCAVADLYGTLFMILGTEQSRLLLEQNTQLDAFLVYTGDSGELMTYCTPGFEQLIIE